MSDIRYVRSVDPVTLQATYNPVITPAGGLALVSGVDKLCQNVTLYLDTARGSHPTDALFGSRFAQGIGDPVQAMDVYTAMLDEVAVYFGPTGPRGTDPLDEQIDHIDILDVSIDPTTLGRLRLTFSVVTRSGTSQIVNTST